MAFEFKDCKIRHMDISDLHPADYNPRTISDKALAGLGKSIERFGLMVPIVWNERSGNIVGGHQRLNRLQASGATSTDVVVVDLSDEDEIALNITLNNPKIRGRFNKDIISALEQTSDYLGSAFNELGLKSLQDYMMSLKFEKPEKKRKEKKEPTEPSMGGGVGDDMPPDDCGLQPEAIVVCPKCRGQFTLSDRRIVKPGEQLDDLEDEVDDEQG